jgi:hypothetical protein
MSSFSRDHLNHGKDYLREEWSPSYPLPTLIQTLDKFRKEIRVVDVVPRRKSSKRSFSHPSR